MLSDWSLHAPSRTLVLHISHALCVVLTFILLLLGGLTGPQTGYWWLVLTVSAGGQTAGEQWRVGGLGNCLAGEGCPMEHRNPPHHSKIHSTLAWHTAASCLFLLSSLAVYLFILFYRKRTTATKWCTLLLPIIIYLLPVLTLCVDLTTRASLANAADIQHVATKPAFWLSTLALITASAWLGTAQWIGWVSHKPAPKERVREEKKKWDPWTLWPWYRKRR